MLVREPIFYLLHQKKKNDVGSRSPDPGIKVKVLQQRLKYVLFTGV